MKFFIIFLAHVFLASACLDPISTVHIQNHEGPIYVSPESRSPCDNHVSIGNQTPSFYSTCNRSPSCDKPIYNRSPSCDNPLCNRSPTCDNPICNRSPTCDNPICNRSPICDNPGCNRSPTFDINCNRNNYSPGSYINHSPTDNPLLHNYPYSVCETDCKCVTKQLGTCVPINTDPQNTGTYYSTYPDYYYCYPEGQYGSDYGSEHGSVGSCPTASEGLIPLLKTLLGQGKCPKHGCQCGQNHSS